MTDRPLYPNFQKTQLYYASKMDYPSLDKGAVLGFRYPSEGIPFGYQPKQPNPGALKFLYLDYAIPRVDGTMLRYPGRGWYEYSKTGEYYGPW